MACWSFVGDDYADRATFANVVNVVLRIERIGYITLLGVKQERVVVVAAEGRIVDSPDEMSGRIYLEVDFHMNCCSRSSCAHLFRWRYSRKSVIRTWVRAINVACGFGNSGIVGLFVVDHRETVGLVRRFRALAGGHGRAHPIRPVWLATSVDYNIGTLTNLRNISA